MNHRVAMKIHNASTWRPSVDQIWKAMLSQRAFARRLERRNIRKYGAARYAARVRAVYESVGMDTLMDSLLKTPSATT